MRLGHRRGRASRNVSTFHASSIRKSGQFFVGIGSCDVRLSLVGLGNEFPERIIGCLAYAVRIRGTLCRPVVHLQGKILKNEAGIRFRGNQALNGGLRRLAGRTLQIAELHDRYGSVLWALGWTGNALLQGPSRRLKWFRSEWNYVTHHRVLTISSNVKPADLLALGSRQNHIHLCQSRHRSRLDTGNLPTHVRLVSECLLHERIHRGFRWKIHGWASRLLRCLRSRGSLRCHDSASEKECKNQVDRTSHWFPFNNHVLG